MKNLRIEEDLPETGTITVKTLKMIICYLCKFIYINTYNLFMFIFVEIVLEWYFFNVDVIVVVLW